MKKLTKVTPSFKPHLPAILYYLKYENRVTTTTLYKIGITNRTVKELFTPADYKHMTVLHKVYFESGYDAYAVEQSLLKMHKKYQYTGEPVLVSGNTELFTKPLNWWYLHVTKAAT